MFCFLLCGLADVFEMKPYKNRFKDAQLVRSPIMSKIFELLSEMA
jgi:hypothetical protein